MMGFGISLKLTPYKHAGRFDDLNDNISQLTSPINQTTPIFMIVVGVCSVISGVVFILAIFSESSVALKITILIFIVLIIATIALIVVAATYPSLSLLKSNMEKSMITDYGSQDVMNNGSLIEDYPPDSVARSWARIQIETKCCGVDGPENYLALSPKHRSEVLFPGESLMEIKYPLSCCEITINVNSRLRIDNLNSCISLTKPSHFNTKGCLDTANYYYTLQSLPAYRLGPILIAFQIVLLVILIKQTFFKKYEEIK